MVFPYFYEKTAQEGAFWPPVNQFLFFWYLDKTYLKDQFVLHLSVYKQPVSVEFLANSSAVEWNLGIWSDKVDPLHIKNC